MGQAKFVVDRCRDLIQHPNQPRSMATQAPDEDDEEARAFYRHTHPPGYGGLVPRGSSMSWVFLLVTPMSRCVIGR